MRSISVPEQEKAPGDSHREKRFLFERHDADTFWSVCFIMNKR